MPNKKVPKYLSYEKGAYHRKKLIIYWLPFKKAGTGRITPDPANDPRSKTLGSREAEKIHFNITNRFIHHA